MRPTLEYLFACIGMFVAWATATHGYITGSVPLALYGVVGVALWARPMFAHSEAVYATLRSRIRRRLGRTPDAPSGPTVTVAVDED